MNFSASVYSKTIPDNTITEIQWVAWNEACELFGVIELDTPDDSTFIPIECVSQDMLESWAKKKLDIVSIKHQLEEKLNV